MSLLEENDWIARVELGDGDGEPPDDGGDDGDDGRDELHDLLDRAIDALDRKDWEKAEGWCVCSAPSLPPGRA